MGLEKLILFNPNSTSAGDIWGSDAARRFPDSDATLYIFAHGNNRTVADDRSGQRQRMTPGDLASVIKQSGLLKDGMNVELLACETAKGDESFAERLSGELGAQVTGYPDRIILGVGTVTPSRPIVFGD